MFTNPRIVTIVRWVARVLAVTLFIFWGMFFIEHLWQWFIQPLPQTPPPKVWFGQFLHLLILVGLVMGIKWERAGGILIIVASVLFFWDKAPIFIPLTILPGVLYLFCWYQEHTTRDHTHAAV